MHLPRTLILYNEPTLPADHPDADAEHDVLDTADCVGKALAEAGLPVERFGVTDDPAALIDGLKRHRPDAIFNLYEGTAGWGNAEAYVCGILELLRIPFTGSPTQPLILCRSKPLTKQLLAGAGLPTAPYFAVDALPVPPCPLPWPVIVKPGKEDASIGIEQASVVTSQQQLEDRVRYVLDAYGPPVLVEQFVRGREFNVAVWERDGVPVTLPLSEILFEDDGGPEPLWPIISFDAKWRPNSRDYKATPFKNPADVTPELFDLLADLSARAFRQAACRDYARIDVRVDANGHPFILEVNPNPCLSPLAGLADALVTAKISYADFVLSLVRAALRRGTRPELADAVGRTSAQEGVQSQPPSDSPSPPHRHFHSSSWKVRPARAADAGNLNDLTTACDTLTPDERAVIARQLRRRLARKDREETTILVLARRGQVGGFAMLTPANLAHGVIAIEAIAIEPSLRRAGLGRSLLAAVEEAAAGAGGRALTADVSSGPAAAGLRQFLARLGYRSAGELFEYYKDGCSRQTFSKALASPAPAVAGPPAAAAT